MILLSIPARVWAQLAPRHPDLLALRNLCRVTISSAPEGLRNEALMLQQQLQAMSIVDSVPMGVDEGGATADGACCHD